MGNRSCLGHYHIRATAETGRNIEMESPRGCEYRGLLVMEMNMERESRRGNVYPRAVEMEMNTERESRRRNDCPNAVVRVKGNDLRVITIPTTNHV